MSHVALGSTGPVVEQGALQRGRLVCDDRVRQPGGQVDQITGGATDRVLRTAGAVVSGDSLPRDTSRSG